MVRGTADITTWFENSNMPYWRVYPHKGITNGNVIMQSDQKEEASHGDAMADLKAKLRVLNRGTFTMVAYSTPERLPTKGYQITDFEITAEDRAGSQAVVAVSGIPAEDVEKRINDALEKYKAGEELKLLKAKVAELEKENKELEKSVNDPWNKIGSVLVPIAEKYMMGSFQQQAAVAGLPEANIEDEGDEQLTDEQNRIISEFVTVVAHNDPDWINTMRKLTEAIKAKPSLLNMVKNFI